MHLLKSFFFPSEVILKLLKRLGIALFTLFLTRVIFYIANSDGFSAVTIFDFIAGSWFDAITIAIFFMPYYALYLIPIPLDYRNSKVYKVVFRVFFHLLNAMMMLFNLIDVEYFKFTSKRSTADLFTLVGTGDDMSQLIGVFIKDFWFLIVLFILFIFLVDYLYRKTDKKEIHLDNKVNVYLVGVYRFIVWGIIFVVIARGGFGLRPVGIIEAANFTKVENSALVLNTPFTIIKTVGKKSLVLHDYMSLEEEGKLFNPIRTTNPLNTLPDKTNVVILILESFGSEYAGLNSKQSFTPFFDSILTQSLFFENAFSNGKKSIEAVPSILASLPTLMDNPYISSSYGNNKINSLATILKEEGYSSAFFHGATNGSMRFDGFAKQVGFDQYFGRKEYNDETHFDGTWGILDEYFNPWSAREMSRLKAPFLATLFTLSSHHPYYIPENRKALFKKGKEPICASLSYADYGLKKFFEEARKQPWFKNTVFVLCADHTPSTKSPFYNQRTQMYKIPIAFYYPNNVKLLKGKSQTVFQQIDIMPSLLDLLNLNKKFYSIGSSFNDENTVRQVVTYIEGSYYAFNKDYMLMFSNDKARNLYSHHSRKNNVQDSLQFYKKEGKIIENKLKAIIQRYSRDLIQNQTTVE